VKGDVMKKIITIMLPLAFCLLLAACFTNNDIVLIEPEPTADVLHISQSTSLLEKGTIPVMSSELMGDDEQPFCYSIYIGIWRGYAIASLETLVITDVIEDEIKFLFVNVFDAAGFPDVASPVYTMPIIDNQIKLVEERANHLGELITFVRILSFYDNYIMLYISWSDNQGEYNGNEWRLTPISEWS